MASLILWILAMYGLACVWVQCKKLWQVQIDPASKTFYICTHYSQSKVEWVIRSISEWAKIEGQDMTIYLIDTGSQDDTLKIIERLTNEGLRIEYLSQMPKEIHYQPQRLQSVIDLREGAFTCGLRTM
ncbi:hypothetical protein [Caldalkalibacillus salinus]|uniref:hypothetical protein n=1 Tax=Caldalkalibacillus salinus TaxID=2803787 RepID=UPI001920813C|nr:hypothetical protein [Caldalkalibacillus salinus]